MGSSLETRPEGERGRGLSSRGQAGASLKERREIIHTSEGQREWVTPVLEGERMTRRHYTTYLVEARDGRGSVLALDYWFLIGPVPVLKLSGQLQLNHLQVPVVMVPGVVTVHTDDVHIGRLGREHETRSTQKAGGSPGRGGRRGTQEATEVLPCVANVGRSDLNRARVSLWTMPLTRLQQDCGEVAREPASAQPGARTRDCGSVSAALLSHWPSLTWP